MQKVTHNFRSYGERDQSLLVVWLCRRMGIETGETGGQPEEDRDTLRGETSGMIDNDRGYSRRHKSSHQTKITAISWDAAVLD